MRHATIFYQAEGYMTNGDKLMGRQAAGEGLLRAAAQSNAELLSCHTDSTQSAQHFAGQLSQYGFRGQTSWVPTNSPAGLANSGCLYLPGPNLMDSAWRRAPLGDRAYSLCGITHTTASHLAMTSITDLLVAPVRSWDALICTSTAVRDTVRIVLENQADYLRDRLGASRFELPQLPVIPLGVHTSDYEFSEVERATSRTNLGIDQNDIVILFVGRLSFHAKAHPQQMFTALERASKKHRVHLVQCGWFPNEPIENAFNDAAKLLCPSITLHYLDGRDAKQRRQAWASAHIFVSLSDNIQETFGLTPIEAMASGLPVIVTDWNGYKDTVRDQIDGYRIPTITPPAPLGTDLAQRYENGTDTYDVYCGLASQLTALAPSALETAFSKLINDGALRQQMGAAGAARGRDTYEWNLIYQRYQTLWDELAERRRADPDLFGQSKSVARPDRLDPFATFAGYPTAQLKPEHRVSLMDGADHLSVRRNLMMNSFAHSVHLPENECTAIIQFLQERGTQTVGEIITGFKPERRSIVVRGLVWLAKMEAVKITINS